MNKLAQLRAALLSAPLGLVEDQITCFTEEGRLLSHASELNQDFRLDYPATVLITGYSGPIDALFYFISQWYKRYQPNHGGGDCRFSADILDHVRADLSITVPLTETVLATSVAAGILLSHPDDPDLNPLSLSADEWSIWARDELLQTWIQTAG